MHNLWHTDMAKRLHQVYKNAIACVCVDSYAVAAVLTVPVISAAHSFDSVGTVHNSCTNESQPACRPNYGIDRLW